MTGDRIELGVIDGEATIRIPRDHFITLHDFMAEMLNTAKKLSEMSDRIGEEHLSMEECAGRMMVVTVLEMDEYTKKNPDALEELMVSEIMKKQPKAYATDRMYG